MKSRRVLLAVATLALVAFDGWWGYQHFYAPNADLTFAGLDSLDVGVPKSMRPARFTNGKWDFGPVTKLEVSMLGGWRMREVALVSLAPELTLGKAVAVLRDLKARKVCNVLIRDSPVDDYYFKAKRRQEVAVITLVLCGEPIGDAGWSGPPPPDRKIRVPPYQF